ncbi:MAG: Endo,4-beta-xylanase precursor [Actinomycetota bacterium]|jgi:uncharacterized repeat protein (TIGR02543 family)
MKKVLCGALSLGLISAVFAAPAALANKAPTKNPPAVYTGNLSGTISYSDSDAPSGVILGAVSLEVDQTVNDNAPIVFANLNLPNNFTWDGDENVTVTSNEDGGGLVTGWSASFSGSGLSIRGLSLTDGSDGDLVTEFTISVSTITGITTTEEATGLYGVSSQYRTNPNRKIKAQTWVVSTPAMIDLTVTQAITWDDNCPDGAATCTVANSGGASTYTTGSTISPIPTTAPEAAGYTFAGWNTQADGNGASVDGAYIPGTPYGAATFYAQWTANTENAITWDDNCPPGGAGTCDAANSGDGASTYTTGSAVGTIPVTAPTADCYSFDSWNTQADGLGASVDGSYQPGTPYGAVTFYAKWNVVC